MADESAARLGGRRILVVEDEYFLADDIAHALASAGAGIAGPVASASEALALIARGDIDGAIIDLNLRDHFAWGVADALLAEHVPFLFATGYDEEAIPERLRDVPRWAKPYQIDALLTALGRSLRAPSGAAAPR